MLTVAAEMTAAQDTRVKNVYVRRTIMIPKWR
jgi:hypothetical protein